ncbi:MAG: Na+/H+ antiporter subunit E [Caldilinea sp.]|nr:Na+/H+ antiporter subunit E [Caldilinea sp.]MDW8442268.1 Na+/H+ antiporter subunit E [Caldilineaceae bacterium]
MKKQTSPTLLVALDATLRSLGFAALWWVLNRGDVESWTLGIPTVALATALSFVMLSPRRWRIRPVGVLRFALYFFWKSLISSIDVAGRVIRPEMPLKPGMVRYPLRLPPCSARVVMSNAASLLPGTLGVDLQGDVLVVNALDVDAHVMEELKHLEERIGDMYGFALAPSSQRPSSAI